MNTGKSYEVTAQMMQQLQETVLNFRIADGFTPKSKLASTEFLGSLLQSITQSEMLSQSWGQGLASMFAHLAQLGGVRGLEQYLPQQQQQPAQGAPSGPAASPPA